MVTAPPSEKLGSAGDPSTPLRCVQNDAHAKSPEGFATHDDLGWHTVWRTRPSESLFQAIVTQLTDQAPPPCQPTQAEIHAAFQTHGGNLRESLFQLYDVVQARLSAGT